MPISPNLSEIVTTTLRNRSGTVADDVTKNNGLLTRLNSRGRKKPHLRRPHHRSGTAVPGKLDLQALFRLRYF
ncbi:hypothetical protein Rleg5DRAFT_5815 [Rhizobium leguminosarum bv. viciae WSM1455]|nr:hypothetical protein Rleg5DRAFT_5815 [Rhizobium leguminosarum bv. viciae WSM1455]